MQGLGAHKNTFLAAIWLECYVLLHYFERARGTKGGFWSQVSMEPNNRTSTVPRFCVRKIKFFGFEHHGCMEVVMQGLRAHSDSFLAAMWLECYVLLHYFERARATMDEFWSQVSMEPSKGTSTLPRFCLGKTEGCSAFGSN